MMSVKEFDAVIIGGGLFGCYAALLLAGKGYSVALVEKESHLFQKASLVNQGRIHGGYHYPRSIETAKQADDYKARFLYDHKDFINFTFDKYYGIDRSRSQITVDDFETFCKDLNLKCVPIEVDGRFNKDAFSGFYQTEEYAINPSQLAAHYIAAVQDNPSIQVFYQMVVSHAEVSSSFWKVRATYSPGDEVVYFRTPVVINATYSAINVLNRIFQADALELTHELSEIVLALSPPIQDIGLTVIDGPFVSFMPFGRNDLISLSSVVYTHHKLSFGDLPSFDCQKNLTYCRPAAPGLCNYCDQRPDSQAAKMTEQLYTYLKQHIPIEIINSQFTIKTKLKASNIDDSRPTLITTHSQNPVFISIFSGKISSIYELEKHFSFLG